jgi:TP901 family phage tail tape measure protein
VSTLDWSKYKKELDRQVAYTINAANKINNSINYQVNVDGSQATQEINNIGSVVNNARRKHEKYTNFLNSQFRGALKNTTSGVINLRNEFNSWSRALRFAQGWLRSFGRMVEKVINPFKNFQAELVAMGTLIRKNYDDVQDFNSSMDVYEKTIIRAGKITGDIQNAAEAAYPAVSKMGEEVLAAAGAYEAMAKATVAGRAGMEDVVALVRSATATTRFTFEDMNELLDITFETVRVADLNFKQFAKTQQKYLALGGNINATFEEQSAVLGTLAGVTGNYNRAGTQTKAIFRSLAKASSRQIETSKELAKQAGIVNFEFSAQSVRTQGLTEWLGKLNKIVEKDINAINKLSLRSNAMTALTLLATEGFEKFNKVLNSNTNAMGAMEKAYQANSQTLEMRIKILRAEWQGFMIETVGKFAPTLIGVIDEINKAFQRLQRDGFFEDFMRDTIQDIRNLINFLGKLSQIVSKNADVIDAAIRSFVSFKIALNIISTIQAYNAAMTGATTATQAFTAAIAANPIGALAIALAGLTAGVVALANSWNKAKIAKMEYWMAGENASEMLQTRINNINDAMKKSGDLFGQVAKDTNNIGRAENMAIPVLRKQLQDYSDEWHRNLDLKGKNYSELLKIANQERMLLKNRLEQNREYQKTINARKEFNDFTEQNLSSEIKINREYEKQLKNIKQLRDFGEIDEEEYQKRIDRLNEWKNTQLSAAKKMKNAQTDLTQNLSKESAERLQNQISYFEEVGNLNSEYWQLRKQQVIDGLQETNGLEQAQVEKLKSIRMQKIKNERETWQKLNELAQQATDVFMQQLDTQSQAWNEHRELTFNEIETVDLFRMQSFNDKVFEMWKQNNEFIYNTVTTISNAFGNAFRTLFDTSKTFSERIKSVFKSILDAFLNIVSQMIAKWLTFVVLTNAFGLPLGGLGSFLGFGEKGMTVKPKMAKGGIIGGQSHTNGGTVFWGSDGSAFEAEKGEMLTIINKNSTDMLKTLSNINQMGGGIPLMKEGGVSIPKHQFGGIQTSQNGLIIAPVADSGMLNELKALRQEVNNLRQENMLNLTTISEKENSTSIEIGDEIIYNSARRGQEIMTGKASTI